MAFRIIPAPSFNRQFINGVTSESAKLIGRKVTASVVALQTEIGEILVDVFSKTNVVQSILGGGPTDLSAHLGLTPTESVSLVEGMRNILRRSTIILTSLRKSQVVSIRAVEDTFSEFRSLPEASHINRRSGIEVPVIDWMLINPEIDIGQAAFDIIFRGDRGGRFDTTIERSSRSGRAIMVALDQLGGGTGYVLPSILRGNAGQNFIEFAVRQQEVVNRIGNLLFRRIR